MVVVNSLLTHTYIILLLKKNLYNSKNYQDLTFYMFILYLFIREVDAPH